ncbi:class I adenylate-forming enzyme family protein [Geomicrobium sp. JCM 19038]|uniref:class I adenylate-forming enzyme family protein n=1 Tax=Geomicrobium sp. JCM 19038 TaxID=1460635 RepID=UPI00045F4C07|nr:class I adenylate-forming enzyme family protein [Geomicrobium sp. JCM 19038]GAK08412.1 long-chain-fatty-acid-CoA ligase [Geomicrobium sp. JCM 19038]
MNSFGTQEELVHRQMEHWAMIQPNHPFVYYGEQRKTLTYRAFNERVNQVANGLLEEGIAKGDRISVFMKNPLMTTVAMFAIWKCGAVFCPINYNFKGKLLSYPLHDTNPIMVITERSMVRRLNDIAYDVPCVNAIVYSPTLRDHDYEESLAKDRLHSIYNEKDWSLIISENRNNPNVELNYFDMANIIYTSGTTGPAKGVVQSHRWVYGYTRGLRRLLTREDVVYNDLPLYHVGGAFANIARAAFVGAGVALYDKFSAMHFWKRIKDSQATSAILLDVMIPWLMNAETKNTDRENTLNKVHMQPLPNYHQEVAHRFGFDVITSGFGQTEVGNPLSSAILHGLDGRGTPDYLRRGYTLDEMMALLKDDCVPIMRGDEVNEKGFMGKPNAHFELAILNEYDEEQPPGVIGQIGFRLNYRLSS